MFSLSSTYSAWWIIPIIGLAAGLSWWFYSGQKNHDQLSFIKRNVLTGLRFFSLLSILLLLLGIVFKTTTREIQKPVIVVACDNSASMAANHDSLTIHNEFPVKIDHLTQSLSKKFDVKTIAFGERIVENQPLTFKDQQTNIGQVFTWTQTNLFNENVGAIVLVSDGIINQGSDPLNTCASISYPIYTIAMGDTLPQSDLSISNVEFNKIAYKDTRFPIVVSIKSNAIQPANYLVKIIKNNVVIDQKEVNINSNYFFQKIPFYITEQTTGLVEYNIVIDRPLNDVNPLNNNFPVFIDVKNDRLKILYLQESWHPDAGAFEQVVKADQHYQLTIANARDFKSDISDFSLIILHQLPSARANLANLFKEAAEKEIPLLFVLGEQTQMNALNQLRLGIEVKQKKNVFDDVFGKLNAGFTLFTVDFDPLLTSGFPPLHVPFGEYPVIPESQVLLYQQVGAISTTKPLIYFTQTANQKVGFICGEGIWRWRLTDYQREGNQLATNEIIAKMIQYLCIRDKKERLVVHVPDINSEDHEVIIDAQLFNKSYEMVNNCEMNMVLNDEKGKTYTYQFQPSEIGYSLNMGQLPKGKYFYTAKAIIGDETLLREGQFIITNASMEKNQLEANHRLLFQLANDHGGRMLYASNMDSLVEYLSVNKQIVSITKSKSDLYDLINLKTIFLLLVIVLALEWFLRKLWGLI